MRLSAEELADELTVTAPRDDGDLAEAAHWRMSRDGLSAQVGYGNQPGFKRQWKRGGFKALWQEFGTKHHPAQSFIRPVFRGKLRVILERINRAVGRTLRRASSGDF
ncbi:hypothetical protein APY04_0167 [Hyphomicrobium sulfonivorans]|uniref:HK97 gp10 family phage protein n=1 Tax=Hyphomicrobium sulfonivorans TaxID=121290 RepID=A0A125NWB4_HYPSL|nr:hypothetical protein [Hyphomicrobium sulfonivorans]KWT72373.1 hypothetical protein APY04_0167 [Hyphomicrobium sulfonivorans]